MHPPAVIAAACRPAAQVWQHLTRACRIANSLRMIVVPLQTVRQVSAKIEHLQTSTANQRNQAGEAKYLDGSFAMSTADELEWCVKAEEAIDVELALQIRMKSKSRE